jgi:hypothetical protein
MFWVVVDYFYDSVCLVLHLVMACFLEYIYCTKKQTLFQVVYFVAKAAPFLAGIGAV